MKSIRINRLRRRKQSLATMGVILALVLTTIFVTAGYLIAIAESLENDVRVEEESELTYFLTVKYNGVDKYGAESTDTATANIRSGVIEVTDRIPDDLEFIGFKTTETGLIGAVERSNDAISCPGHVIDDTEEESVDEGTWNAGHTEYTYHGLHYYANTRTVKFKTVNVQAGCDLTVGIITKTPSLGDADRKDFYNTGRVSEGNINKDSNTVHAWMGKDTALVHTVSYSYTGDVPENAPALPSEQQYVQGATVSVAFEPTLDGYEFSGWTTSDATVSDESFTMPDQNVSFVGIFTEKQNVTTYKVTYEILGDAPSGYVVPKEKSYKAGTTVNIDSTKKDDTIDDYIFEGWSSDDVAISDGSFSMPEKDVVIQGSFKRQTYTVTYEFKGSVLPPNAASLVPGVTSYPAGENVTIADNPTASGYRFSGWYSASSFKMPANNVVIYGEWIVEEGTFSPTISINILNEKEPYHVGQTVEFEITVTNPAEFALTDVRILEQLDGAKFISGEGYTIIEDQLASITRLEAGASIKLKAQFAVTENETTEISNTVSIVGARATAENYNIDTSKDYTATATFNTESWQDAPVLTGITTNGITLFITLIAIGVCGIGAGVIVSKRKK